MDKLELIPIVQLLGKSFFIPSYQRGYRWEERQVVDLLEDILEFQKKDKEKGEFYCLQPIVVTLKKNEEWEVIDGQQRLTTLYLILTYLENLLIEDYFIENIYKISYETREKEEYSSKEFLENIKRHKEISTENPDFYHISKAYHIIDNWFMENIREKNITKRKFLEILIDSDMLESEDTPKDIANNVRFIWYAVQTEDSNDAKDIFTRINMGKIPLSNAELIKALFFIHDSRSDMAREKHQQKLAYEWDRIENTLQNKNFWFFINKGYSDTPTKIEFIFDLIANKYRDKISIKIDKSIDQYYTFYIFNSLITNQIKTKAELWKEIKIYFRTFEEWYFNNEYYHLIGYLIHIEKNIESIKSLAENNTKSDFKKKLIQLIENETSRSFQINKVGTLIELSYQDNKKLISRILLLFNVVSSMESQYIKFPFERYVEEKWSIEHIHARGSEELKTDKQRKLLLEEQQTFFQHMLEEAFIERINDILESDHIDINSFNELQKEIFEKYIDDNFNIDSIDNLALLAANDNSALNNNIFPIKRDKIIELDERGSFIPLCTKNVFLKYYSKEVDQNVTWTKKDREAYINEIKNRLVSYLPEESNIHEN